MNWGDFIAGFVAGTGLLSLVLLLWRRHEARQDEEEIYLGEAWHREQQASKRHR